MSARNLRPGEVVDIALTRVRVVDVGIQTLAVVYPDGGDEHRVELVLNETVTVTRVASAEWPPKPGQVWVDSGGVLWFAHDDPQFKDPILRSVYGTWSKVESFLGRNAPVRLVFDPTRSSTSDSAVEHKLASSVCGGPGSCGVSCACGTTFDGFDTLAEPLELLNLYSRNHPGQVQVFDVVKAVTVKALKPC